MNSYNLPSRISLSLIVLSVFASGLANSQSYLEELQKNTPESRGQLAARIASNFSPLLESPKDQFKITNLMINKTINQLKNPETNCPPEQKIKLYRGHGIILLAENENTHRPYILNNYLQSQLPRFSLPQLEIGPRGFEFLWTEQGSWEDQYIKFLPSNNLKVDYLEAYKKFVDYHRRNSQGPIADAFNPDDKNKVDPFIQASELHTLDSTDSILISLATSLPYAIKWKSPYLEVDICYSRVLPTSSQAWEEAEFLAPFHIFPEEISKVHMPEASLIYRGLLNQNIPAETKESILNKLEEKQMLYGQDHEEARVNTLTTVSRDCYLAKFQGDVNPAYEKAALGEQVNSLRSTILEMIQLNLSKSAFERSLKTFQKEQCSCEKFVERAHNLHQKAEPNTPRIFHPEDC